MSTEAVIALAVALIAAAPGLLAFLNQHTEASATAADRVTDAAVDLLEQYKARIDVLEMTVETQARKLEEQNQKIQAMEVELDALTTLVNEYRQGINILVNQLTALGQLPRYRPAPTAKDAPKNSGGKV